MSDMATAKWDDLSDEKYRTYTFPGGNEYTIYRPQKLNVKAKPEGHSHRVISHTTEGKPVSHYIPAGWIALEWEVVKGAVPFQFLEAGK